MLRKLISIYLAVLLFLIIVWLLLVEWQVFGSAVPTDRINHILSVVFNVIYALTIVTVVYAVVRENGDPSKTIAWMLIILALPLLGMILYSFLGKSLRKEKLFTRKRTHDLQVLDELVAKQLLRFEKGKVRQFPSIEPYQRLVRLQLRSGKFLLMPDNRVRVLQDGTATFEALFTALEQAQAYIHIEYYIFEEGDLADRIATILIEKVQQGIPARLIYDGVGSWSLSKKYLQRLQAAEIDVFPFMPVHFGPLANRINYRNHRKIVVVDGKIGFTGGINVSDKYIKGDPQLGHWRDTHLQIEGQAVDFLQYIFLTDWQFVSGQNLLEEKYFPPHDRVGTTPVQIIASGPDSDYASIHQTYVSMLYNAQRYVYLANAYLIPDESMLMALKTAALSGVDVRILIPEVLDSFIVKWSTRSYLEELLTADVKIYFYQKGFLHSKVIVADDSIASIGTANLDIRSFEQNLEVNALLYDAEIAQQLKDQFLADLQDSEPLDLTTYQQRSRFDRAKESIFRVLSPVL